MELIGSDRIQIYSFGFVTPSERRVCGTLATEEPWVGIAAVAAHLEVGKDTVYRWIDTEGLPAHWVGGLLRLRLSQLDKRAQKSGDDEPNRRSSSTAAMNARSDQGNG